MLLLITAGLLLPASSLNMLCAVYVLGPLKASGVRTNPLQKPAANLVVKRVLNHHKPNHEKLHVLGRQMGGSPRIAGGFSSHFFSSCVSFVLPKPGPGFFSLSWLGLRRLRPSSPGLARDRGDDPVTGPRAGTGLEDPLSGAVTL